ncbi:hypothetical protein YC2023_031932 [Brassica napus]
MRKHGWQLPYHPLQVVAVAVFLALGFAFFVFFAPFVGNKIHQYIAMSIYTPLSVTEAFPLLESVILLSALIDLLEVSGIFFLDYIAASDPADRGVFRSKKYLKVPENGKLPQSKDTKDGCGSTKSHNSMCT